RPGRHPRSLHDARPILALSLILYLGIDGMVTMIPKIGEDIVHYMPFSALNTWIMDGDVAGAPWDSVTGSGLVTESHGAPATSPSDRKSTRLNSSHVSIS